ncbi:MAG: hypothetical protein ACRENE_29290, partial [Polyangiaceae bacterium]
MTVSASTTDQDDGAFSRLSRWARGSSWRARALDAAPLLAPALASLFLARHAIGAILEKVGHPAA